MRTIKKLRITVKIAIFFIIVPLLLSFFEDYLGWVVSLIILFISLSLFGLVFFKNKNLESYSHDFNILHIYVHFIFGFLLLLFAIIATSGTIEDIIQGDPVPLWGILITLGLWIFGILIVYYTYQARKESSLKGELKPKAKIERDKIRKFNTNYLMVFYILAAIMGFIFKLYSLTLRNIFIGIFILIIMYFLLRKFS